MYMRTENHPPLIPPRSSSCTRTQPGNPPLIRRSFPRYPPLSGCTCHNRQRSQQLLRSRTFSDSQSHTYVSHYETYVILFKLWPLALCRPCAMSHTVLIQHMMWCTLYAVAILTPTYSYQLPLRSHRHDVIRRPTSLAPKDMLRHKLLRASKPMLAELLQLSKQVVNR